MIKRFFSKKKEADLRFVPFEEYRALNTSQSTKKTGSSITRSWMNPDDALKVDIVYKHSGYVAPAQQNTFFKSSKPKLISGTEQNYKAEEIIILKEPKEELKKAPKNEILRYSKKSFPFLTIKTNRTSFHSESVKTLGIISDTKMYSALIQSELKSYNLNIKYFNHPRTFTQSKYALFDNISAWILFLSEDVDDAFLDRFFDRYIDKPSLLLFAKASRKKTAEKIKKFIIDTGLASTEPVQCY